MCVHSSMYRSIQLLWEEYNTHLSKVVSSLNHALIIQFFKVYRLEGKWVLEHAVFTRGLLGVPILCTFSSFVHF